MKYIAFCDLLDSLLVYAILLTVRACVLARLCIVYRGSMQSVVNGLILWVTRLTVM